MMGDKGINKNSKKVVKEILEDSIGVEIGVWKGSSSKQFLKKAKHLHLVDSWSVEPYKSSNEHGTYENYLERYSKLVGSSNPLDFEKYYEETYQQVCRDFKDKNVTIHRMLSKDFLDSFNEKVDWVYIDGAHDFFGCYSDIVGCSKILKPNGVIFGDDYNQKTKPGVKKAVDFFVLEHNFLLEYLGSNQYKIRMQQ